eukprot:CAMPEP_0179372238 /NCGR_PEP_ID=MMETSP0797-20121207/86155_1 /TAXON_ID=47934 /ORGANISM="Dinophysis acuminata, Strain DAEP01" /LENGTH=213 /DNA_ID=CAMNT_0021088149 /DNA_START=730 /DNA_END=1367 /DNA_ORIENTATION=+
MTIAATHALDFPLNWWSAAHWIRTRHALGFPLNSQILSQFGVPVFGASDVRATVGSDSLAFISVVEVAMIVVGRVVVVAVVNVVVVMVVVVAVLLVVLVVVVGVSVFVLDVEVVCVVVRVVVVCVVCVIVVRVRVVVDVGGGGSCRFALSMHSRYSSCFLKGWNEALSLLSQFFQPWGGVAMILGEQAEVVITFHTQHLAEALVYEHVLPPAA